jgi:hypothetical protein
VLHLLYMIHLIPGYYLNLYAFVSNQGDEVLALHASTSSPYSLSPASSTASMVYVSEAKARKMSMAKPAEAVAPPARR